jgi:signal transduction histidine kinase
MSRYLLAACVIVTDTALLVGAHLGQVPVWGIAAYALAVTFVVMLRYRSPVAAFAVALVLAALTGGTFVLLIWTAYQAGHAIVSRPGTAMIIGATAGGLGVQLALRPAQPRAIPNLVTTFVVFVALPLLVGRYLAQHERLLATLKEHNRQLRWKRELTAEQERLRERLRIARDMHDSLGHRLSLVTIQAAALEVSQLRVRERDAVRQLAGAARDAMNELYELVGTLRGEDTPLSPGVERIDTVVAEFQAAGVPVTLHRRGEPRALSGPAGSAAYRVVEEGLTNATKHAPGQPVSVSVEWEPDAVLLTVTNPLVGQPSNVGGGHGLTGLSERVRPAGGLLDHRLSDQGFRLFAMLPAAADEPVADDPTPVGRFRAVTLAFATAVVMFVALPASLLLGIR